MPVAELYTWGKWTAVAVELDHTQGPRRIEVLVQIDGGQTLVLFLLESDDHLVVPPPKDIALVLARREAEE